MNTYKFTLRDPMGAVTFGAENVKNWDATKIALTRNKTYRGAFFKLTTEFEFTGAIRRRLIQLVDKYGSEVEIYLSIYLGNGNKENGSFKMLGNGERKADMTTWEPGELVCKLGFVGSGFEETLFNRHDTDTEYSKTESIDGVAIPTLENEFRVANLHDRVLQYNGAFDLRTDNITHTWNGGTIFFSVPMDIKFASDTDFKNTFPTFSTDRSGVEDYFLLNASEDKQIKIDYAISFDLLLSLSNLGSLIFELSIVHVDENYNLKSDTQIYIGSDTGSNQSHFIQYFNTITHDIKKGDSLALMCAIAYSNIENISVFFEFYPNDNIITSNSSSFYPATTAPVILPHELFSRLASIYTGSQMPFYSSVFGRVELGYPVDGEWAYLSAANGKMLRDFPFNDAKFATNLKDAFAAYNCIGNLAGTIEQTNNGPQFRIERYADMFDGAVVVSLGDMIAGVGRKLNTEAMFGEIIAGYNKIELENLNGLDTFNGDFNFTPPIKSVTTKLDIRCKWITNDYAIEQTRRMQYKETPKEDTKFDDNIFLLDLKPIPGSTALEAVKDEDYTSVTGILNPSTAYNLRLSPGQNLRRWGNVIRAAMPKGGIIKYSSATKNTSLVTVKDGVTIVENSDIDVSTLDNPISLNETLTVQQFPINRDQWTAIESNPKGLFHFKNKGVNLYGYIEDVEFDTAKETGTVTLIRANR